MVAARTRRAPPTPDLPCTPELAAFRYRAAMASRVSHTAVPLVGNAYAPGGGAEWWKQVVDYTDGSPATRTSLVTRSAMIVDRDGLACLFHRGA